MVKRKRRGFTKEFKAQAVRTARESGKAVDTGHGNRTLLIERTSQESDGLLREGESVSFGFIAAEKAAVPVRLACRVACWSSTSGRRAPRVAHAGVRTGRRCSSQLQALAVSSLAVVMSGDHAALIVCSHVPQFGLEGASRLLPQPGTRPVNPTRVMGRSITG
jgi:transposase-like protein